jgi:hypothetical protein
MKKLIFTATLIIILSLPAFAANLEYPYLYKSPRAMGMGGTYVAIGGKVDTLFYNPAGLSMMPEGDWEVNLLGLDFEAGENVCGGIGDVMSVVFAGDPKECEGLIGDIATAADEEDEDKQLTDINNAIQKNIGENLHLRLASSQVSMGRNGGKIAIGFGAYENGSLDLMAHQGLGSEGLIEFKVDGIGGVVGGMSYKVKEDLYVGAAMKYFYRAKMEHNLTAREIAEKGDDLFDYIWDESGGDGGAIGTDLGMLYIYEKNQEWYYPTIGLSLLNIGGLNFGDAGEIPMTVNLGASAGIKSPYLPYFKHLVYGVDIVDLFSGYEQDSDISKRLRIGGELGLFDINWVSMVVRTGFYQGYPTFGTELKFVGITLAYTVYTEEIGAYAGQEPDKRQMLTLIAGW